MDDLNNTRLLSIGLPFMFLGLTSCATVNTPVAPIMSEETVNKTADIDETADGLTSQDCTAPQSCEMQAVSAPSTVNNAQPPSQTIKKYPPLIYGQPQALICDQPYLPKGTLSDRPNLQLMWENYIYEKPQRVWEEIGGAVEVNGCLPADKGRWGNACAVRLSHMLNKAQHKIPAKAGQTVSGGNGDQYFYRLEDAQNYLMRVFGAPDVSMKDASGQYIELPNHPGILIMRFPGSSFTGHATVWNGAGTVDGVNLSAFEVYFWKTPCFTPLGR